MRERIRSLERAVEAALALGLLAATLLLVGGLGLDQEAWLRAGILLLMFTPVVRVLLVTLGLAHAREWRFAAVSALVLGVLAAGMAVGARL